MEKVKQEITDWDRYYHQKKSFFSVYTQRFTLELIEDAIDKYCSEGTTLVELGGGNSCFAKNLCKDKNVICRYDIVDSNEYSVNLFKEQKLSGVLCEGRCFDLKDNEGLKIDRRYDFVYSIGLIEHFISEERSRVIQSHYKFCRPGGIVFISFPTPTLKYRIIRKGMELTHTWQFWDEHPLTEDMVKADMIKDGNILDIKLNKKLPLSQMVMIGRKKHSLYTT